MTCKHCTQDKKCESCLFDDFMDEIGELITGAVGVLAEKVEKGNFNPVKT